MCIERNHPKVILGRQCQMLSLARSNLYYAPKGESAETLRFMELIDKQFLETPWYGSWQPLGTLLRNTLPSSAYRHIGL
jgi:putative transposase